VTCTDPNCNVEGPPHHHVTHYENALNIAASAFLNKDQEYSEGTIRKLLAVIEYLENSRWLTDG
jgi:hypothetical protein